MPRGRRSQAASRAASPGSRPWPVDPNGDGQPAWPRHDPAVDRLLHFTNAGIIAGTDPLKPRLDLWARVGSRGG